jgi:hypothetical protein
MSDGGLKGSRCAHGKMEDPNGRAHMARGELVRGYRGRITWRWVTGSRSREGRLTVTDIVMVYVLCLAVLAGRWSASAFNGLPMMLHLSA